VVGDTVDIQLQGAEGVMVALHPRRNLFYRSDAQRSKSFAANIDQLLVVIAGEPLFSIDLLGRALVAAYSAGIHPLIVLNKADRPASLARARAQLAQWQVPCAGKDANAVPPVLTLSALDAPDLYRQLLPHLAHRRSLLLGQSGMGKTTLLNALVPEAQAATQTHSTALETGRHTTTSTRLYQLPASDLSEPDLSGQPGQLIDSPGFQNFGLHHLSASDLLHGFPALLPYARACRFYNCTHQHEPGCGVLAALAAGQIPAAQHALYLRILQENQAVQRY